MPKQEKNLEQAMARVEEIVRLLDDNSVSLEESISLYSEGVKLTEKCLVMIDNAKQVIEEKQV